MTKFRAKNDNQTFFYHDYPRRRKCPTKEKVK